MGHWSTWEGFDIKSLWELLRILLEAKYNIQFREEELTLNELNQLIGENGALINLIGHGIILTGGIGSVTDWKISFIIDIWNAVNQLSSGLLDRLAEIEMLDTNGITVRDYLNEYVKENSLNWNESQLAAEVFKAVFGSLEFELGYLGAVPCIANPNGCLAVSDEKKQGKYIILSTITFNADMPIVDGKDNIYYQEEYTLLEILQHEIEHRINYLRDVPPSSQLNPNLTREGFKFWAGSSSEPEELFPDAVLNWMLNSFEGQVADELMEHLENIMQPIVVDQIRTWLEANRE